jgi:hypothetical protein
LAAQGLHGLAAAQGLHGLAAAQGLQGLAAAQGLHGLAAAQGLHGLQGFLAAQGLQGLQVAIWTEVSAAWTALGRAAVPAKATTALNATAVSINLLRLSFDMAGLLSSSLLAVRPAAPRVTG